MLSINISELVLTIVSFFILLFLLNRFLYTPVLKFMNERKARIDASLETERTAQIAMDALSAEIDEKKAAQREAGKTLLDEQRKEDAKAQSALTKTLHAESTEARREAKAAVDAMAAHAKEQLSSQRDELANTLANKLMNK